MKSDTTTEDRRNKKGDLYWRVGFSLSTEPVCVRLQHSILEVKKEIHKTKLNILYQHYFIIATVINKISK